MLWLKDTGDLYYKTSYYKAKGGSQPWTAQTDHQQQDANTIPVEGSSVDLAGPCNSQDNESEA
ncbi:hypothetical protein COLO4_09286 [Corchorus olitorius]|uniref:Uncharacterized protein n=1 Tax=Corchorus olitorius TaxID=93759 RepID=A0A1R3KCJ8_9ROSI|nr:hypothetical protein COLO4_09286 [Corchorus olitorius]